MAIRRQMGHAERIIETEIGCGPFQVLISILIFSFVKIASIFTFIFMTYGNYNPGWRCLDNDTIYQDYHHNNHNHHNESHHHAPQTPSNASVEYSRDFTCQEYEACQRVEFNPESSTVVTEWGLVCDRAWISSLLISIQMAGNLVGSFVSGQTADTFGRKKTLYGSLLVNTILTSISAFSISWEMLATFRFLIGFALAFFESLNYVYPAEFFSKKWRGPMIGIPGWAIGGILFGVIAMLLKDWRHLLLASSIVFAVCFLPVVWVPESLRWLEVRNRTKEFQRATQKMAKMNRKNLAKTDGVNESKCVDPGAEEIELRDLTKRTYTVLDLFRPGYRRISVIIGFSWLNLSVVFYAISYGVKALSGDFYINLIMMYTVNLPFVIFPLFATNVLGRRKASSVFILISGACCFVAMILELVASGDFRVLGVLAVVIFGLICTDTSWTSQQVHLTELYPTVARGLAMNSANVMTRIGGIVAPFIIPRDSNNVYVWYLIMGCLATVCCCLFSTLPETKGLPLKETFEDNNTDNVVVDDNDHIGRKEEYPERILNCHDDEV